MWGAPEDKALFPEVILPTVVEGVELPTLPEVNGLGFVSALAAVASLTLGGGGGPPPGGACWCRAM